MEKLTYLKRIYGLLKNPNQESLNLSMNDVHNEGLFSLVIDGTEFGKLTRVFIANSELLPNDVQIHTHRYPIALTTIKGLIRHHYAERETVKTGRGVSLSEFNYKSPLNGGEGLSYVKESRFLIEDCYLPVGSTVLMSENDFHTVSCEKGSIWIVEESGFRNDSSLVIGVPFVTDGLYTAPKSFQINDSVQIAMRAVKNLINAYESI